MSAARNPVTTTQPIRRFRGTDTKRNRSMTTTRKTTRRPNTAKARAEISETIAQLTRQLRKLHGGRWTATADHGSRFVLIREHMKGRAGR